MGSLHAPRLLIPVVVEAYFMIRVGQRAPNSILPGAAAGTIETHGISEYTDRGWAVVLVFYPLDFHPACTDQWCSLRDADWRCTLVTDIGGESPRFRWEKVTAPERSVRSLP